MFRSAYYNKWKKRHPEWRKLSSRIYFGICELMLEQDAETSSA